MPGDSPLYFLRARSRSRAEDDLQLWVGIARGFAGALLFSIPILMTMETWWLGFYMYRVRLLVFLVPMFPVLVGVAYYSGLKESRSWTGALADALIGAGIGILTSALVLVVFDVIRFGAMEVHEIAGMVALQSASTGFGAVLARSQVSGGGDRRRQERAGYWAQLFFMLAGALYLGYSVAPSQEMILIAYKMTMWHTLGLMALSVLLMQGFVYAVSTRPGWEININDPWWSLLLRFTFPGYVLSFAVSLFLLWIFGRFAVANLHWVIADSTVLAFPASIGAAAARFVF